MPTNPHRGARDEEYYRNEAGVIRPAPLSREDEQDLFVRYRKKRTAVLREKIVRQYLYWAAQLACRYAGPRMPKQDAISAANYGLMLAIEDFDPARGRRFVTHSFYAIRRTVLEALRDTYIVDPTSGVNAARHVYNTSEKTDADRAQLQSARRQIFDTVGSHVPLTVSRSCVASNGQVPKHANYTFHDSDPALRDEDKSIPAAVRFGVVADRNLVQTDDRPAIEQANLLELIRERLKLLPTSERRILQLRYFSDPPLVFRQIGKRLRLEEDQIRYLHNRALARLRKDIKKEI